MAAPGDKRKAMEPAHVLSVEDVAQWFGAHIDDGKCGKMGLDDKERILQAVRENEVPRLFVVQFWCLMTTVTTAAN